MISSEGSGIISRHEISPLLSLSPLDGRYKERGDPLRPIVSEYGLMRYGVRVEVEWLIFLSREQALTEIAPLADLEYEKLQQIADHFNQQSAEAIKAIEKSTNHDVKAVEYYLQETFKNVQLRNFKSLINSQHRRILNRF